MESSVIESSNEPGSEPRSTTPSQHQALIFTGTGGEYFRIWIVNLALTIVTLGIFSAWAKVRRLRYFHGHTQLDGHGFEYLGDPKRILLGRLIAVGLLIIYSVVTRYMPTYAFPLVCLLAVLVPFILVSSIAFTLRNTAYRHIRFRFRTNYMAAYKLIWLPIVLALALAGLVYAAIPETIGSDQAGNVISKVNFLPQILVLCFLPMIPWLDSLRTRFIIDHSQYGSLCGKFKAGAGSFYGLYGMMLLITVAAIVMMSFAAAVIMGIFLGGAKPTPGALIKFTLVFLIPIYLVMFLLSGWFTSRRNNLLRDRTQFGKHSLAGNFSARALAWLMFTNLIGVMFTLGLFIPWAMVRLARYNAAHTWINPEELDGVTAEHDKDRSAIGEEIGDFFDIDIGL